MILPLSNAATAWEHVVQAGSGGGGGRPVLVFAAAPDPDALVAVRTITGLLRTDLVQYEVHPVGGYRHLRESFKALTEGEAAIDPRAVLCVNCGAGVDLGAVLGIGAAPAADVGEDDGVKVFVVDSHRPYHLRNVNSDRVFLFDDSPEVFDTSALPFDLGWEDEWGNVADADTEDEDEERDEESGSTSSSDGSDGSDEGVEEEDDDVRFDDDGSDAGGGASERKRKRRPKERHARRRQRRRRDRPHVDATERKERRALREYYAGAPAGMASACLAHNLAALLRRSSNDTLWAAIVGVTHQYLSAAVEAGVYEDAVEYCRKQVAEHKAIGEGRRGVGGGSGEEGPVLNAGYGPTMGGEASGVAQAILASTEFRLDLVRHWTLHESLMCSSYTLTRMAAWRQTGKRRLQELLATLGIPLSESKQKWCYMKQECKTALDDRLARSVRRFDLGKDIQYDSFLRVLPGHRGKISAADVVYGLSALLELDGSDMAAAEDGASRDGAAAALPEELTYALERRFWRAYDAMDAQRSSALSGGLQLAIMAQKLSASVGGAVLEHKQFHTSGPFRYVFLRDFHGKELFSHPLLLKRLALFLIEAMVRQGVKDKPFVVVAPSPTRNVWLAVAAMSAGSRNEFGQHFRRAANKNGSQITFDGFDATACEIQDGQETDFIRYLHDVML